MRRKSVPRAADVGSALLLCGMLAGCAAQHYHPAPIAADRSGRGVRGAPALGSWAAGFRGAGSRPVGVAAFLLGLSNPVARRPVFQSDPRCGASAHCRIAGAAPHRRRAPQPEPRAHPGNSESLFADARPVFSHRDRGQARLSPASRSKLGSGCAARAGAGRLDGAQFRASRTGGPPAGIANAGAIARRGGSAHRAGAVARGDCLRGRDLATGSLDGRGRALASAHGRGRCRGAVGGIRGRARGRDRHTRRCARGGADRLARMGIAAERRDPAAR